MIIIILMIIGIVILIINIMIMIRFITYAIIISQYIDKLPEKCISIFMSSLS